MLFLPLQGCYFAFLRNFPFFAFFLFIRLFVSVAQITFAYFFFSFLWATVTIFKYCIVFSCVHHTVYLYQSPGGVELEIDGAELNRPSLDSQIQKVKIVREGGSRIQINIRMYIKRLTPKAKFFMIQGGTSLSLFKLYNQISNLFDFMLR